MQGCTSEETDNLINYKYATIHTDMFEDSEIYLYDEDGIFLSKKNINYSGITYSAFMESPISINNKIYFANPQSGYRTNTFILELDKRTLKFNEISNERKIPPTVWTVDEEFAYMAGGSIDYSEIVKINIATGEEIAYKTYDGQTPFILENDDTLYLLTINYTNQNDTYGNINIINKKDLSIIDTIKIDDITFSNDMIIIDNTLYLLKMYDGNDMLSNELIKIDLETKEVEQISMPFNTLKNMHIYKDNIYITQGDTNNEPTSRKIAKYNLNGSEIEVFTTEIENYVSYIYEDRFITSDGEIIQIYNIDTFQKENEFILKQTNINFVSFFVNVY